MRSRQKLIFLVSFFLITFSLLVYLIVTGVKKTDDNIDVKVGNKEVENVTYNISYNGGKVDYQHMPFKEDGQIYISIEETFKLAGFSSNKINDELLLENKTLRFNVKANDLSFVLNNHTYQLKHPIVLKDEHFYATVENVSKMFGTKGKWDVNSKQVSIAFTHNYDKLLTQLVIGDNSLDEEDVFIIYDWLCFANDNKLLAKFKGHMPPKLSGGEYEFIQLPNKNISKNEYKQNRNLFSDMYRLEEGVGPNGRYIHVSKQKIIGLDLNENFIIGEYLRGYYL